MITIYTCAANKIPHVYSGKIPKPETGLGRMRQAWPSPAREKKKTLTFGVYSVRNSMTQYNVSKILRKREYVEQNPQKHDTKAENMHPSIQENMQKIPYIIMNTTMK